MADKKISALTGASTPLAGTEVLPIVQSGATVKVSVANLTAGRDVSAKDLTTTGNTILGDASTDTLNVGSGDIIKDANGNVGIGQASPYNNAAFKTLAVGGSKVGFVGLYNASNALQATLDTYNNTFRIGTNGTTNPIAFYLGGSVTNTMQLHSSTGVSIGNTTDPGATNLSVTGTVDGSSFIPTAAPSSKWAFDGTNSALLVTIANDATYDVAVGSGIIYSWDNGGNGVAITYTYYGTADTQFNPQAFYSNTQGTAGKINIYYNGSTAYRFENKTGSSKSIYIVTIRTRVAT